MSNASIIRAEAGVPFEDGPDRGRILVFGRDTGGRYGLMDWTVAPADGGSYGLHLHREMEETFYVRRGELEFRLGETVSTLKTGDFVRVPPGEPHGYINRSGAEVELLVSFHPGGFEELFLKHRTDREGPPEGEDFVAEATRLHASEFDL